MIQLFTTPSGIELHLKLDEVDDTRAWILLLHGLHDHLGRYDHVVRSLNRQGFSVMRYDLRGHGRSGGRRVYISRFADHVSDFGEVVDRIRPVVGSKPLHVIAHSMGALVAASWILEHPGVFAGAVFTGGLFQVNPEISPFLQKISGFLSVVWPTLRTVRIDPERLTRDRSVLQTARRDPLHYQKGVRVRTGAEILHATRSIESRLSEWSLPVLILHGGADALTKPVASRALYEQAKSTDKTLKIYEGAYHELLHEINRDEVVGDILDWLEERV